MAYTVQQIIDIARISQFLAANDASLGNFFGKRLCPDTAKVLYMERKAVEWLYNLDGAVQGVGATGSIEITFIGFQGDKIEIIVNGTSLGIYTRAAGDTDTTILAASIASYFNGANGFTFSSALGVISIDAPASLGATVNGELVVNFTPTTTYPYVEYISVTSITSSTAFAYGISYTNGVILGFDNTGYCISTSPNPDLGDTVFSAGGGSGALGMPLTGLASGTTYYIRMYGTYNTSTTIYSEQSSFTTL